MVKLVWLPSLDTFPETTGFKIAEVPAGRVWGRIRELGENPESKARTFTEPNSQVAS
jgi:hypothetical protein